MFATSGNTFIDFIAVIFCWHSFFIVFFLISYSLIIYPYYTMCEDMTEDTYYLINSYEEHLCLKVVTCPL